MPFIFLFLLTFSITFVLTLLLIRLLLPLLRHRHLGQKILEIGPAWHSAKEGTPTMGGLAFVISALLALALSGGMLYKALPALFWRPLLLTGLYALGNAAIGMIDDLTKFRKNQNEGLSPSQKLFLQFSIAALYLVLLRYFGYIDSTLFIPYLSITAELGYFYDLLAILLLVGFVNFANLTDGIDGLASSVSLVYGAFFAIAAAVMKDTPVLLLATALVGASLGFLCFNRHPALLFMGDTGSLFLGAMAIGCAFLLGNPLLSVIVGGVYILEGVSVILQVGYYKLTKKRLFRMAPIHHHLERCGWKENQIVLFFTFLGLVLALVAFWGLI